MINSIFNLKQKLYFYKMSSQLHSLLNNIDSRLQNGGTRSNFYETRVKQDLQFFKDQKYAQSEFQRFPTDPYLSKISSLQGSNLPLNTTTNFISNQTTDAEIRKMIEREMEPYLFKMKNELALTMENYRKEMEEYTHLKPELQLLKENLEANKKACQLNQDENDKKFINFTQKYTSNAKQIEDLKQNVNDLKKNYNSIENMYTTFNLKMPDIELLNEKLAYFDLNSEKYYKDIENNINKNLDTKLNLIQSQIDNIKETNKEMGSSITTLKLSNQNINSDIEQVQSSQKEVLTALNKQNISFNNLSGNCNNTINQIEKYKITINALEEKLSTLYQGVNSQNENITTLQLGFTTLSNEFTSATMKQNDINDKVEQIKSNCTSMTSSIITNGTAIKTINEKISKINSKLSEYEDKNNAGNLNLLNEKIAKLQMNIDELGDFSNGKFASLNNKVSELSLALSELINGNIKPKSSNSERIDYIPPGNFDTFRTGQAKYNDNFLKALETLTKEVSTLKKDVNAYDDNFEKIQENFIKLNNQIDKISSLEKNVKLFPELIDNLSKNHNILKNDVEKNFKVINEWEDKLNTNINQTIEDLKNEIDRKIETEKIANTINTGHNIDSSSYRSSRPSEILNKVLLLENNIKKQQFTIDNLNKRFADKIAFEKHIEKFEKNESVLNDLDHYIENKILSMFDESENNNKPSTFSKRNVVSDRNIISDRQITKAIPIPEPKQEQDLPQDVYIANYPQGTISNTIRNGNILEGYPRQREGDSEYFVIDGIAPKKIFKSDTNNIEKRLPIFGNTEKIMKNNLYNELDGTNLTTKKNQFDEGFLESMIMPSKNEPIIIEGEYEAENENDNETSNNYGGFDHDVVEDNKRESFNAYNSGTFKQDDDIDNILKGAGIQMNQNQSSQVHEKKETIESNFDDDDDFDS